MSLSFVAPFPVKPILAMEQQNTFVKKENVNFSFLNNELIETRGASSVPKKGVGFKRDRVGSRCAVGKAFSVYSLGFSGGRFVAGPMHQHNF